MVNATYLEDLPYETHTLDENDYARLIGGQHGRTHMKTKLTLEIDYDPAMTDPEGLAYAMDQLLETALSTPSILSDYGNPTIGQFFVAKETVSPAAKVVLDISGGVLQDVFGSDPAIAVTRVDWDTGGSDSSEPGAVEIPDGRGGMQLARWLNIQYRH